MSTRPRFALFVMMLMLTAAAGLHAASPSSEGWVKLFNGEDLSGWQVSEAAAESWSVQDGVIDCDPKSTLEGDRNIWTEDEYEDFVLYIEWRITDTPTEDSFPVVEPDGTHRTDADGEVVMQTFPNADSGIFLRGQVDAQVNIWNWPIGSGEVYGYRVNPSMPAEVREAVTPSKRADKPIGEWNTYVITMIGDRLSVMLNGELVIDHAQLPGVAESGPIALQYHGGYDFENEQYLTASSLVQFRNIYVKPLNAE